MVGEPSRRHCRRTEVWAVVPLSTGVNHGAGPGRGGETATMSGDASAREAPARGRMGRGYASFTPWFHDADALWHLGRGLADPLQRAGITAVVARCVEVLATVVGVPRRTGAGWESTELLSVPWPDGTMLSIQMSPVDQSAGPLDGWLLGLDLEQVLLSFAGSEAGVVAQLARRSSRSRDGEPLAIVAACEAGEVTVSIG